MANTPYQTLEVITRELKKRAEAGDWETAAQIAVQLGAQLQPGRFPAATPSDRAAIEASLAHIAAITERAGPLQADIARLLQAFGPALPEK